MQRVVMIAMLLVLSTKHAHGTEWDCTGASNTGTFQRSTGCTISGTTTTNGGGVVVTNTLEIVGTVEDMNNLIVITAPSKQRHFYINGVNNKLVLRYLKLTGGDVSDYRSNPAKDGGSIDTTITSVASTQPPFETVMVKLTVPLFTSVTPGVYVASSSEASSNVPSPEVVHNTVPLAAVANAVKVEDEQIV